MGMDVAKNRTDQTNMTAPFKLERRGEVPEFDPEKVDFYRSTLELFLREGLPFLVGGTHALYRYTGILRRTKDFDVFIRRSDYPRFEKVLEENGFETELKFPHWLGKIHKGDAFMDLIFAGGNGEAAIDDEWFDHSVEGRIFGLDIRLVAPEEMIWSKTYVMERERYDGADVIHLIFKTATRLDWQRLIRRFGEHWRLLLMNLVYFGFIYPGERGRIPREVMAELIGRLQNDISERAPRDRACFGTLVSRAQYLVDVEEWGYEDARLKPRGSLTADEIGLWTDAIDKQ
jgi:hypothetical protein